MEKQIHDLLDRFITGREKAESDVEKAYGQGAIDALHTLLYDKLPPFEKPRELATDDFDVFCTGCSKRHRFSETLLGTRPFTFYCKVCEVV